MATLQDILICLTRGRSVKRERVLTIDACAPRLRRIAARRRPPIPYEKGPLGGYLVPFKVRDGRRARECVYRVVIEMYAPTPARPYWFPVELEVDFMAVCALMKSPKSTAYRRVQSFRSIRYRGGRLFFDRDELYEHDLPLLDRVLPRDEERPFEEHQVRNGRPGRHRRDCADHDHPSKCPAPEPSPAHTRRRPHDRQPRRGRRWSPRPASPRRPHEKNAAPQLQHATISEVVAWDMAKGDVARFAALRDEIAPDIAAEEAARCVDRAYVRTATGLAHASSAERTTKHAGARRN